MLETLFSMRGKVCVVTGGSTGLGSYMAQGFLEAGAERVYITARSADKLQAKAEELSAIASGECLPVVGDLSTLEGVEALAARLRDQESFIDVLVNNAGSELNKTYDETTIDEWDRVLDTDLKGPWLLCKYFVPSMVEHGAGSVINVSSLNGLVGFPLSTAYGSAKGGLVVFTKDMAIELATSGVRINCVCPGVIQTPMMERWTDLMPDKEEAKAMLRGVMPIGRMGTAEEVAGAILFFASEDSSLCQGAVLSVDGGFTAQ